MRKLLLLELDMSTARTDAEQAFRGGAIYGCDKTIGPTKRAEKAIKKARAEAKTSSSKATTIQDFLEGLLADILEFRSSVGQFWLSNSKTPATDSPSASGQEPCPRTVLPLWSDGPYFCDLHNAAKTLKTTKGSRPLCLQ